MKKKITKNQVLGFGLAIATPFIIAACDDKPKGGGTDNSCKCPNGTEHDSKPCCDGTGCVCTEKPKLVEKSYPVELENSFGKKTTITIKYMGLEDAAAPNYLEYLKGELVYVAAVHTDLIDKMSGKVYIIKIEYDDYYDGFNRIPGSETIKVHDKYLSDSKKNGTYLDTELEQAFRSFFANVMMNNMIRMADRFDSWQHIVSGTKLV